jgi:hypothetical protein
MGRPARHRHHLECAKDEALLACDLYNERRRKRNLEAFLVHMSMAWNNLLQAILTQQKVSFFHKQQNGRFVRTRDGEKQSWSTRDMLRHLTPGENDPMRKNVEFFIGLRDKVEHRLTPEQQQALREIVAGKSQAYLRNFEALLVTHFPDDSVASELHLPICPCSFPLLMKMPSKRSSRYELPCLRTYVRTSINSKRDWTML